MSDEPLESKVAQHAIEISQTVRTLSEIRDEIKENRRHSDANLDALVTAAEAAPTKGALVGIIASWRALWQATVAAAASVTDYFTFNFGDMRETKGIILRGAFQEICLTFLVALASAGTLAIDIEWTEE